MSKNLKKGLAFGAILALSTTLMSGLPASAAAGTAGTGPAEVALTPTTGDSFASILQAGISLKTNVPGIVEGTAGDDSLPIESRNNVATDLMYKVTNSAGAAITVKYVGADGGSQVTSTYTSSTNGTVLSGASNSTGDAAKASAATSLIVGPGSQNAGQDGALLVIGTTETADVTLKVQSWFDTDNDGVLDLAERKSTEQTVVLYNAASLATTTTLTAPTAKTNTTLSAKVAFVPAINTVQAASYFGVQFYARNSIVKTAAATANAAGTGLNSTASATLATTAGQPGVATNGDVGLGNFTARAFLDKNNTSTDGTDTDSDNIETDVFLGNNSATVTLFDGVDSTVNGVYLTSKSSADVLYTDDTTAGNDTANTADVRAGAKSITLTAQVTKADGTDVGTLNDDYKGANVLVRVSVTSSVLKVGNTITVNGGDKAIAAAGDVAKSYLRTDADGKVSITLTASTGTNLDAVTVDVATLLADDTYADATNGTDAGSNPDASSVTVTWKKAVVSKFDVSPAKTVSGDNIALTFYTQDQFGEGISATSDGALKVYAVAEVAGVEKTALLEKDQAVVAGKVAVSVANFATKGGSATIKGYLYVDGFSATKKTGSFSPVSNVVSVDVFNNNATGFITVSSSYSGAITYGDYITGDEAISTTFKLNEQLDAAATITGGVQDANGGAQAASQVTVSATGLLFVNNGVWAKDTITFYTDAQGGFTFDVYAQKVNLTGHTITIASGGKTVTTLLKTYLPATTSSADWKLTWNLPAVLVKNTTYALTANLSDKWGNPIKNASIDFAAAGSLQVNGLDAANNKLTDKNGNAIVYVRSVKDVAGPGSLSATIDTSGWKTITGLTSVANTTTTINTTETENDYTAWTEASWSNAVSADVDIKDVAPAAASSAAASGSTGKFYASATNAAGKWVVVKVNGKFAKSFAGTAAKKVISVVASKGSKTITVYVGGKLALTKVVIVK